MSEQSSSAGAFLFQTLTIVVGWIVVHHLSAQRDRDKARRELTAEACEALSSAVDSLLEDALKYHAGARDAALERKIKMVLQDLALQIAELSSVCSSTHLLSACRSAVGRARRAMTSTHFEDEHESPLQESDPIFQDLATVTLDLKRHLARLKFSQFPIKGSTAAG